MPRIVVPPDLPDLPDVLRRDQLNAAGISDDRIRRLVRAGLWREPAGSVYVRRPVITERDRLMAAALDLGPRHAVTGGAGLRALGVRGAPAGPDVHVLMEHRRQVSATAPLHYLRTTRRPGTWSGGDGIRIASPERCALDAAWLSRDLREARAVLAAVACWGVGVDCLVAELTSVPRQHSAVVRRAVGDVVAGARSAPEAELGDILAQAVRARRLPPFLLNPQLHLDGCLVGSPDAWIAGAGVGVQVDSREFHEADVDFDRTLARHDSFATTGLTLLHVTPARLRRLGSAYADLVVGAVEARRGAGAAEPPGLEVVPCGPLLPVTR